MKIRWSKIAPQAALVPAVAVTLTAFVGAPTVDHPGNAVVKTLTLS
jgi:hypothetical protein